MPPRQPPRPALRRRLLAKNEPQAREKITRLIEPFLEILEADDFGGEPPSEEWKEVLKPAVFARRAVLSQIDKVTFGRGRTQRFSTSQTPHTFPVFAEMLLADFLNVCANPNSSELQMLAEACEAKVYIVEAKKRQLSIR